MILLSAMQLATSKMSNMLLAAGVVLISVALVLRWFQEKHAPDDSSEQALGIAQVLSLLQRELRQADEQQAQAGTAPLFHIGAADIEINYVVKKTVGGDVRLVALPVGASAQQANERTQKITIHMTTIDDTTRIIQEIPDPESAATRPGGWP